MRPGGGNQNHCLPEDMADFPKMNAVYAEFFPDNPTRPQHRPGGTPKGGAIEIEVVAILS